MSALNGSNKQKSKVPSMGPEPTILSRKEVDALYETFEATITALGVLGVDYIVTGGSLLGAIRQHSILFCDDDIDIGIIDRDGAYAKVCQNLSGLLGPDFQYSQKPWEGGDKVRPKRMSNVFLDIFCLRRYNTTKELVDVIGLKKNGQQQGEDYVNGIVSIIEDCAISQSETADLCPFWHFATRKAVEMWSKEVYREHELFPLTQNLKFGPLQGIKGPRMPVLLLKRAFGIDCFNMFCQSSSHKIATAAKHHKQIGDSKGAMKPIIQAGGTWEGGTKLPLEEEHYIPMQPICRSKRRPTYHSKEQLFQYLAMQTDLEKKWIREETHQIRGERPRRTVYMDGVFDLFHVGHLNAIRECARLGDRVIIGITGDKDAAGYKRRPIIRQKDRVAIIKAIRHVDDVICPCPLVVTEDFMKKERVDLVVHGFASDADAERQNVFFATPIRLGKFKRIEYYQDLSTTDIIKNIRISSDDTDTPSKYGAQAVSKPKWFGAVVASAAANAPSIATDPVPLELREVIEPHIRKATARRHAALNAIREATGTLKFDQVITHFKRSGLGAEGEFSFDTDRYPLLVAFLKSSGLPVDTDLRRLHEEVKAKNTALYTLTKQSSEFQIVYDSFVRDVCAPHMASLLADCEEIYYQAFPCIRIIQPDEFSIGPHADVAYGHHPCSVNYYVPLTQIGQDSNTSGLFMESRPGSEDWHPILGTYGKVVKHFAGAICMHWTTDNKTEFTRVSLDFRLIAGPMFDALACGGSVPGGQRDVYREKKGYYSVCKRVHSDDEVRWLREGTQLEPDARVGFPWTVKNWEKLRKPKDIHHYPSHK